MNSYQADFVMYYTKKPFTFSITLNYFSLRNKHSTNTGNSMPVRIKLDGSEEK